jgi:hypothetical protein
MELDLMATLGVDCQIVLDGNGYMLAPSGHTVQRPRLRKATVAKGGAERYVDSGPGKREWHLRLLALTQMTDYSGQLLPLQGVAVRNALKASYEKVATTLGFTDVDGSVWSVRFDSYEEHVVDPRTQVTGVSYHVDVVLIEA